jgi:hypothetical protein
VRRAVADDEHLEMTLQILEAAARTTYANKLRALSRVLANGLTDDAADTHPFLRAAVIAVEAPHVQVLLALRDPDQKPDLQDVRLTTSAWNPYHLAEAMPGLNGVMPAIVRALTLHGLVYEYPSQGLTSMTIPTYTVTELGGDLLQLLEDPDPPLSDL